MPKDELNVWLVATECHSEFGTSGSLVADVKSLVSEARPSVDTLIVWVMSYDKPVASNASFVVTQQTVLILFVEFWRREVWLMAYS